MSEEKRTDDAAVEETTVLENTASETEQVEDATQAAAQPEAETTESAETGANESEPEAASEPPAEKRPDRKKAAIIAAAACLAIAVGGVAVMSANHTAQPIAQEQKAKASKKTKKSVETAEATIKVTADGLTSDSSAVITHWTGASGNAKGTEFYHATSAEAAPQGTDKVKVAVGKWKVEVLPSVNVDGSINEGTSEAVDVEVKAEETSTVEQGVTTTPAEEVSQDRLNEVLDEVNAAISKGDKTLTGDAGADVVNRVTDNASKNPNADATQIEQKRDEGAAAAQETKPQETAPAKQDTGSGSSSSSSSNSGSSSKSDSNKQQASQKSDSGKDNSSSGSSSSKAECSHNWVAQTTTRWVQDSAAYDEQVCTQAAWDEQVLAGEYYKCGADGYITYDWADLNAHLDALLDAGKSDGYQGIPYYKTIHHDATYSTVHHDATGHNETVTTGYRCSKCGTTK